MKGSPRRDGAAEGCRDSVAVGERGQALLVVLLVLLLLGVVFAALSALMLERMREARAESRRVALTALVDGGLAETLANMASRSPSPGVDRELGGGRVRSVVLGVGGERPTVRVTASLDGVEMRVEARTRRTDHGWVVTAWRRLPAVEGEAGADDGEGGADGDGGVGILPPGGRPARP